jgi:hypothetical protein
MLELINQRYAQWLGPNTHMRFKYIGPDLHMIGQIPHVANGGGLRAIRDRLFQAYHQIDRYYGLNVVTNADFVEYGFGTLIDWKSLLCCTPITVHVDNEPVKFIIIDVRYNSCHQLVFSYLPITNYSCVETQTGLGFCPPIVLTNMRTRDGEHTEPILLESFHQLIADKIAGILRHFPEIHWPKFQVESLLKWNGRIIKRKAAYTLPYT